MRVCLGRIWELTVFQNVIVSIATARSSGADCGAINLTVCIHLVVVDVSSKAFKTTKSEGMTVDASFFGVVPKSQTKQPMSTKPRAHEHMEMAKDVGWSLLAFGWHPHFHPVGAFSFCSMITALRRIFSSRTSLDRSCKDFSS